MFFHLVPIFIHTGRSHGHTKITVARIWIHGVGYDTVAGLIGKTSFDASGVRIVILRIEIWVDQSVGCGHHPFRTFFRAIQRRIGVAGLVADFHEVWGIHGIFRYNGHVVGCGIMVFIVEPMDIGKMCVFAA